MSTSTSPHPAPAPAPAKTAKTSRLRPSGQLWTVLRLHRTALWVWVAFVVISIGVLLWVRYGSTGVDAAATLAGCGTAGHRACDEWMWSDTALVTTRDRLLEIGQVLRNLAPVVAAWAGAALIGRELENGTAELAWTQSVSPARWLATKLAVPAAFLTVGAGVLVASYRMLLDWSVTHHMLRAGYEKYTLYFNIGPATVAYTLLGLAVGALAALLLRRAVPALVAGAAAAWLLTVAIAPWRGSLWPVGAVGDSSLWHLPGSDSCGGGIYNHNLIDSVDPCISAQPADHYLPVQLVETGIVLALAAVLVLISFRVLHRRNA
ncbi:hypothetical protein [Streptomyces beijiangensis]|uniref:ABC transporter permease n=1 Tax=Streptomyces beijiangensis TaxID=163361 RepID=A0A939F697_9ACTN|nr:hypothetical protein [Streptomyces beijiangensis]MBO0512636.1 hypothetical protein [Streptomyces beijiangensis]